MNMPGPAELMAIALVALLIFGPRRMPEIGKSVGKALREFRRISQEMTDTVHGALDVDDEPEPAPRKRRAVPRTEEED
jgi:sec-independent protein translocase protein TatA